MGNNGSKVAAIVMQRIMEQLEAGVVPWHKPWKAGLAQNFVSGRPYTGINQLLLGSSDYELPYWLTWNQTDELNAQLKYTWPIHVRKGERHTKIVYMGKWKIDQENSKTGELEEKTLNLLRYYRVWNVDQIEGLHQHERIVQWTTQAGEFKPDKCCETTLKNYPKPQPTFKHAGSRACYNILDDLIKVPARHTFDTVSSYYATAFHEYGHSTGHKDRCNRDMGMMDEEYSFEELVAEICSAMLCAQCRIDNEREIKNTAAYIEHWKKHLVNDPRVLLKASRLAQQGFEYILEGKKPEVRDG